MNCCFNLNDISVLILPFDLQNNEQYLKYTSKYSNLIPFWEQIKSIQLYFDELGDLPDVFINDQGEYLINY